MFSDSINKATLCLKSGDIPVYAFVFDKSGKIAGEGINNRQLRKKISGHAEINAINVATRNLDTLNLEGFSLFTTLEPCEMCYGAIKHAKINQIYYLVDNEKMGFKSINSLNDIKIKFIKIDDQLLVEEYKNLLNEFFKTKR